MYVQCFTLDSRQIEVALRTFGKHNIGNKAHWINVAIPEIKDNYNFYTLAKNVIVDEQYSFGVCAQLESLTLHELSHKIYSSYFLWMFSGNDCCSIIKVSLEFITDRKCSEYKPLMMTFYIKIYRCLYSLFRCHIDATQW